MHSKTLELLVLAKLVSNQLPSFAHLEIGLKGLFNGFCVQSQPGTHQLAAAEPPNSHQALYQQAMLGMNALQCASSH